MMHVFVIPSADSLAWCRLCPPLCAQTPNPRKQKGEKVLTNTHTPKKNGREVFTHTRRAHVCLLAKDFPKEKHISGVRNQPDLASPGALEASLDWSTLPSQRSPTQGISCCLLAAWGRCWVTVEQNCRFQSGHTWLSHDCDGGGTPHKHRL